jgi:hypothetical protein
MDGYTTSSIKKALEQSVIDTNRVLKQWKRSSQPNFTNYDSVRGLLIGWMHRHLRTAVGYKYVRVYGKPIITIDSETATVTSIMFPNTLGVANYGAAHLNTICDSLDYKGLAERMPDTISLAPTNSTFAEVETIFDKIRNTKFE